MRRWAALSEGHVCGVRIRVFRGVSEKSKKSIMSFVAASFGVRGGMFQFVSTSFSGDEVSYCTWLT